MTEIRIPAHAFTQRLTKVALFSRVSGRHGEGPELQLRELREYAASRGWTIAEEYECVDCGVSDSKRNILLFPSRTQFPKPGDQPVTMSIYAAVIQAPCSRWTKPWRHQKTIVLFAESAQAMKQRLATEGRVSPQCFVLQVFKVKGGSQ